MEQPLRLHPLYQKLTGIEPDLSRLRVSGCPAYVHIDHGNRNKLDDKAWEGIFVGYADDNPAWLIFNPSTSNVMRSRSVTFNEHWSPTRVGGGDNVDAKYYHDDDNSDGPSSPGEHDHTPPPGPPSPAVTRAAARRQAEQQRQTEQTADNVAAAADNDDVAVAFVANAEEPTTHRQAVQGPHSEQWKAAIEKEYNSLVDNDTWELVTPPPGCHAIGSMWRFKVKRGAQVA